MLTTEQIAAAVKCSLATARIWVGPLNATMVRFEINTPKRQAAFLGQIAHESAHLSRVTENFNYTPEALLATFNTRSPRFTKYDAYRYGRTAQHPADQEAIANIAYAGRMGNGPMESGDGWRHRGRGPGQLTGKNNYTKCGAALGIDLVSNPDLVEQPDIGALAFGWFWNEGNATGKSLNMLADAGDIDAISDAVNIGQLTEREGDAHGFKARVALTEGALRALA